MVEPHPLQTADSIHTQQSELTQTDGNRILSVVHIKVGKNNQQAGADEIPPISHLQTQIAKNMSVQATIMHQICPQSVAGELDGYPMACLPIANRPIVAHQIKYLELNNIFNIYVVVHQDAVNKTRTYLLQHYEADPRSNIYLVVCKEEETESTNALKMMCELQTKQEAMGDLPDYEQELYRKRGTKRQMDMINFNKEHTIVFDGHCLPDLPLSIPLTDHQFNGATITQVARELDLKNKSPIQNKNATYGIYGYCDFAPPNATSYGTQAAESTGNSQDHIKRLIMKTDNHRANDLSVKLRRSLLKRCQNLRIRTDLQAEGLFFVKTWLLKLIPQFEAHLSQGPKRKEGEDSDTD